MKSRILNLDKLRYQKQTRGSAVAFRVAWAGHQIKSRKLGFSVTVIPPGKRAFPYHAHHANEELFFVLAGRGTIRIGKGRHRIRAGDFISLPPGREFAHQILNDSDAPLRYLAVSTMESPEVAEYPDSGKIGVFTGVAPGQKPARGDLRCFLRSRDQVDYWEGE